MRERQCASVQWGLAMVALAAVLCVVPGKVEGAIWSVQESGKDDHRNVSMFELNQVLQRFGRGCPGNPGRCRGGEPLSQREWDADVALLKDRLVVHHDPAATERFGNPVRGVSLLPFHSSEAHQRRINVRAALASPQSYVPLASSPSTIPSSVAHPSHAPPPSTSSHPSDTNTHSFQTHPPPTSPSVATAPTSHSLLSHTPPTGASSHSSDSSTHPFQTHPPPTSPLVTKAPTPPSLPSGGYTLVPQTVPSASSSRRCTPTQCPTLSRCPHAPLLDVAACQAPRVQPPWDLTSALVLRDVFINNEGVVYNATTIFDFDDCTLGEQGQPQTWHSHRRGSPVVHLERAFSLVHHWGRNFYHSMLEVLPMFFALAEFLKEDPGLPILMKENLYREYVRYGKLVTGIDESQLNVVFPVHMRVQIFVKELIQPQFSPCMTPDAKVLSVLREHFFLRPHGLPFFTPALRLRASGTGPEAEPMDQGASGAHGISQGNPSDPGDRLDQRGSRAQGVSGGQGGSGHQGGSGAQGGSRDLGDSSDDWRVVVYLRPWGTARSLANETAVVEELISLFGDSRVHLLRRNLPIQEAMDLFHKAKLFVSVHGGALTNMVFMPGDARIFEFRLKGYNVPLYEDMASAIRLQYYSAMVEGGKGTVARANVSDVVQRLRLVHKDMTKRRRDS